MPGMDINSTSMVLIIIQAVLPVSSVGVAVSIVVIMKIPFLLP